MLRWLARYFGLHDPYAEAKRRARLSEAEALAIARRAGAHVSDRFSLHFTALIEEEQEQIWIFETSSRGRIWSVRIRDRDGQVLGSARLGVR